MIIPHDQLNPETLAALLEEFVTRDGALHGHADTPVEAMVASVRRQLEGGSAVIVFDEETETASIVTRESLRGGESSPEPEAEVNVETEAEVEVEADADEYQGE